MIKKTRNSVLLFILLFTGFITQSHGRNYYVEAIIFEHPMTSESEVWNFSPENLKEKVDHFASFSTKDSNFKFSNHLRNLGLVEANLKNSGLKILTTASWTQPSAVYRHAPLISLGIEGSALPDAFIRVYKTSLIFVDIDLQFVPINPTIDQFNDFSTLKDTDQDTRITAEVPNPHPVIPGQIPIDLEVIYPARYFLSEKRRLKFKEIHYFDHPEFGAILGVWPSES